MIYMLASFVLTNNACMLLSEQLYTCKYTFRSKRVYDTLTKRMPIPLLTDISARSLESLRIDCATSCWLQPPRKQLLRLAGKINESLETGEFNLNRFPFKYR